VLGDHLWWTLPFVRRFVAAIGVVDGTRENIDYLLSRDQLVLVLPGGLREAVKPRELRYQLLWGHRYGFVHAAIRNQAPMIPLASVGSDELFDFVGNPYERGRRWLKPLHIPLPLPATILPMPRRVNMKFVLGAPVLPRSPSTDQNELSHVRSMRREIEGALHELIEGELWRRLEQE
jgi:1-acyl-sn-glycerol-3-phosphate acyltransferase